MPFVNTVEPINFLSRNSSLLSFRRDNIWASPAQSGVEGGSFPLQYIKNRAPLGWCSLVKRQNQVSTAIPSQTTKFSHNDKIFSQDTIHVGSDAMFFPQKYETNRRHEVLKNRLLAPESLEFPLRNEKSLLSVKETNFNWLPITSKNKRSWIIEEDRGKKIRLIPYFKDISFSSDPVLSCN